MLAPKNCPKRAPKWVEKVIEGNMSDGDHAILSALSDRTGNTEENLLDVTEEEEDLIINLNKVIP